MAEPMEAVSDERVVGIGDNNPPAPTPYETAVATIDTLYDEAKLWLDGEKVDSQGLADGIGILLNSIRTARKSTDAARKAENEPFDTGKSEVQARYNPLLKKADLATETCKNALVPWLEKLQREKDEAAERARIEADERERIAQEAIRASQADNLEERETAEALVNDAKHSRATATRAGRDTAKVSGGDGRAVSLRTTYTPVLTDPVLAIQHYWPTSRREIEALLMTLAERDTRIGIREIPGFEIEEVKSAV